MNKYFWLRDFDRIFDRFKRYTYKNWNKGYLFLFYILYNHHYLEQSLLLLLCYVTNRKDFLKD